MYARTARITFFWAFAGGLVGLGAVTIFSIGLALVLLGIFLMCYWFAMFGYRGMWAALVGFWVLPSSLLIYTDSSTGLLNEPEGMGIMLTALMPFALIGMIGILWGLTIWVQRRKLPH